MTSPETTLNFLIRSGERRTGETIAIRHAVIAGWTGRDQEALEKHIRELEEMGIARPASTPIFYCVAASRLSMAGAIEVSGAQSSGEVEFVLVQHGGVLYVGAGSDHTDRGVEAYNVTVSKQMCEKPIAAELWPYDEIKGDWDRLMLRSWACDGGKRTLYQEGSVTAMRTPEDLIPRYAPSGRLEDGTLMFCGTLAAKGGIRPAPRFEFELENPVRGWRIAQGYDVVTLPVAG